MSVRATCLLATVSNNGLVVSMLGLILAPWGLAASPYDGLIVAAAQCLPVRARRLGGVATWSAPYDRLDFGTTSGSDIALHLSGLLYDSMQTRVQDAGARWYVCPS